MFESDSCLTLQCCMLQLDNLIGRNEIVPAIRNLNKVPDYIL